MSGIDEQAASQVHAGLMAGHPGISGDGHGLYSIPISVPPGTKKIQPKLSLVYASYHENGWLGQGWKLSGLSVITRVGQTMAQDNKWTSVNYTESDCFALDGQRLIVIPSLSINGPATYHTEVETWLNIVPIFEQGVDGPAGFKVTAKNGIKMEYGLDAGTSSRIMAVGKTAVRVWALNRMEDLFGNYLTISYTNDAGTGSYYPLKIEYTGNSNLSVAPQRSVVFTYEERTDPVIHYQGGSCAKQVKRLKTISTFLETTPVLNYSFGYQYARRSGLTQLVSVTLSDGNGIPLPAASFQWTDDQEDDLFMPVKNLPAPVNVPHQLGSSFTMDVTGNGQNDLIRVWSDNGLLRYAIFFSGLDGFDRIYISESIQLPFYGTSIGLQAADIDGDGRGDLVYFFLDLTTHKLNYASLISDGEKFQVFGPWPVEVDLFPGVLPMILPIDVTGNGRSDIVFPLAIDGCLHLQVLLSNGKQYIPQPLQSTSIPLRNHFPSKMLPVSITGSPRQDLIYAYWQDNKMNLVSLISGGAVSDGKCFTAAETYSYALASDNNSRLIPINLTGDELTDIALARQTSNGMVLDLFVSDGTRICAPDPGLISVPLPNATGHLIPMDISGDGRMDLLHAYRGQDGNYVLIPYLCDGQTFRATNPLPQTIPWSQNAIMAISLDGSGRTGLLYMNNPLQPKPSGEWDMRLIKAGNIYPGLITTFQNGIGGEIHLQYESLATPGVYVPGSPQQNQIPGVSQLANLSGMSIPVGAAGNDKPISFGSIRPRRFITAPLYVVTSFKQTDGRGNVYTRSYTYQGARIDLTGRGWLGFEKRIIIEKEDNRQVVESYYQRFPVESKIYKRTGYRLSDLSVLTVTKHEYLDQSQFEGIHSTLKLRETREYFTYAKDESAPDYTREHEYGYGQFDNIKLESFINTYSDGKSNTLYTGFKYDDDIANHRLGYLLEKKTCSDEQLLDILTLVNYCRYNGTMAIKTKTVWVNKTPASPLSETRTYDDYGNLLSIDHTGELSRQYVFDDTNFNTFPVTIIDPPNNQGVTFLQRFTYDMRFGKKISHVDSNGKISFHKLDGLGRVIEKHGPDLTGADFLYEKISRKMSPGCGYSVICKFAQDWSGERWQVKEKYHDGMNRVFQHAAYGVVGQMNSTVVMIAMILDGRNRVKQKSQPFFEGQVPVYITKSFDPYGHLNHSQQPIDTATDLEYSFIYNSNTITTSRVISHTESMSMQSTKERFGIKDRIVGFLDGENESTEMHYDALGRLKEVLLHGEIRESIGYDSADRKISLEANSLGNVNYIHDPGNRMLTEQHGAGNIIYLYDRSGRIISVTYSADAVLTYEYDLPGSENGNSRLCTVKLVKAGQEIYTRKLDYYPNGRIKMESLFIDSLQFITSYTYSPVGQVTSVKVLEGPELKQEYTETGFLQSVSFRAGDKEDWTEYVRYKNYTAMGCPQDVQYPVSGIGNHYEYNAAGLIATHSITSGSQTIHNDTFGFDGLARIKTASRNKSTLQYNYDGAGRLKSLTGAPFTDSSYTYDSNGNFLTKDGYTFTYSEGQIVVTDTGGKTCTYLFDTQGNLSRKDLGGKVLNFSFDDLGRLASVSDSQGQLRAYWYDEKAIRLKSIEHDTGKTIYQIHSWYKALKRENGTITQELQISGPTGIVANFVLDSSAPPGQRVRDRKFVHADHTSSVIMVTDESGNIATKISYYPFGSVFELTGTDSLINRFGSKEWDALTGLYYFNARYYDPRLGRFISPDSQVTSHSLAHDVFNRYVFVLNDPVNFQDPSGHGFLEFLMLIVGVVEVIVGAVIAEEVPSLGGALIGAGIAGAGYSIAALAANQQNFNWAGWGIAEGAGFLIGLIGGAVGGAAAAAGAPEADAGADAGAVAGMDPAAEEGAEPGIGEQAQEPVEQADDNLVRRRRIVGAERTIENMGRDTFGLVMRQLDPEDMLNLAQTNTVMRGNVAVFLGGTADDTAPAIQNLVQVLRNNFVRDAADALDIQNMDLDAMLRNPWYNWLYNNEEEYVRGLSIFLPRPN